MSSSAGKSREEIIAERQEKKKRKAALKNQSKEKTQDATKEIFNNNLEKKGEPVFCSVDLSNTPGSIESKDKSQNECEVFVPLSECGISVVVSGNRNQGKSDKSNVKSIDLRKNQNENSKTVEITTTKTKAQLKAERRAKQEEERARKLEKAQASVPLQEKKVLKSVGKSSEPVKVPSTQKSISGDFGHKVKLFAHLYNIGFDLDLIHGNQEKIHPGIIQLGAQYSSKVVSGANACCLALLNAFKKVVMDFETPLNQEFSRGLEAEITKSMAYLNKCRPIAVSMMNAVKHLKFQITQSNGNELECKNNISEWIDIYIKEQLEMAAKAICLFVREKISPGDVILTYGCSSLIQQILISVHNEGINFQVIVVDGRPSLEGREMLKKLVSVGIHCTYVFVNGLSFIMPEVTKILLGAHALLANGYVMSHAGSSQIALLAKTYNVPVLVCCETHKFSERVQTDAFVYNELGNPDDLASKKGCLSQELSKWKSIQFLTPLNLTYDVTPPDLVSAVVTEIAVLPCTSVPVILRIKPADVSC